MGCGQVQRKELGVLGTSRDGGKAAPEPQLSPYHTGDALSEEASRRFEQYPGQLNNQIS